MVVTNSIISLEPYDYYYFFLFFFRRRIRQIIFHQHFLILFFRIQYSPRNRENVIFFPVYVFDTSHTLYIYFLRKSSLFFAFLHIQKLGAIEGKYTDKNYQRTMMLKTTTID